MATAGIKPHPEDGSLKSPPPRALVIATATPATAGSEAARSRPKGYQVQ